MCGETLKYLSCALAEALSHARFEVQSNAVSADPQGVDRDALHFRKFFTVFTFVLLFKPVVLDDDHPALIRKALQTVVQTGSTLGHFRVVLLQNRPLDLVFVFGYLLVPSLLFNQLGRDQLRHPVNKAVEVEDVLAFEDLASHTVYYLVGAFFRSHYSPPKKVLQEFYTYDFILLRRAIPIGVEPRKEDVEGLLSKNPLFFHGSRRIH